MEDKSLKMTEPSEAKGMTIDELAVLTQNEFLALEKKFATKEDLKAFKEEIKEDMMGYKDEIKEDMHKNMGAFLTKADAISGKLDKLIEDGRAGTALYQRHDEAIENHGKRISTLETSVLSK